MKQKFKKENTKWPDNSIYFLTDSTFIHFPYFRTSEQKEIVLKRFRDLEEKMGIKIEDYSIAMNHYHLRFYLDYGQKFAKIKQLLRGGISYEYRKTYEAPYKAMWQNGKVLILTSEEATWKVSGYICGNLLKHKEVGTFVELRENEFSSYGIRAKEYGDEDMEKLVCKVIDVGEDAWGGIDVGEFNKIKLNKYPWRILGH